METKSLEEWRKYFESGNCSIYQIIFNAIRIAALDDPEEFKLRRNKIVERLYSCQFTGLCCCCVDQTEKDIHSTIKQVFQDCKNACAHHKSTKVVDDSAVGGARATDQQANEQGNNDEDEDETVRCVLQIRDELESNELTDSEIYGSLKKLQLVVQSVFVMEATKIGKTISNLRRHRTKEISLLATIMADQWKSKIVEFVDNKTAGTTAEKSKNPVPRFVLDEWREFPSVEYVPQPPVEFSEKFLDDMDDYEIMGKTDATGKDDNETDRERHKNVAKEKETEPKLQESMKREKTKKELVEKFTNHRRSNGSSDKSPVKVEKTDATTTEKNHSMGTKRKPEEQDAELITSIRRQKLETPKQELSRHKPSKSALNPNIAKTERASSDRDEKPRLKKEGQNHNYDEPHNRYRALRINAEPRHASPRASESRRSSSDKTATEERLETSEKKLQVGYEAHERAKRNIQLIPEGDLLHRKEPNSKMKARHGV